jgi:death-on-curing family protein
VRTRGVTVEVSAAESGIDLEELLIRLWDLGFDDLHDERQALKPRQTHEIRRVLGLPSAHQISRPGYWRGALGLDHDQLTALLEESGLSLSSRAKTLPKGAVKVLKRYALRDRLLQTPPVQRLAPTSDSSKPVPVFLWEPVGSVEARHFLDADEVKGINAALGEDFAQTADPIGAGVRDQNLLESAVFRQHTASREDRKYPTAVMTAAALFHSLVLDHAFDDGNKRTALVSMLVVLDENGIMLTCDEESLFKVVLRLANHEIVPKDWPSRADREVKWIAEWIAHNSRPVEKGERIIQWHKLKQIFSRFGASCATAHGKGNRINITREVRAPRSLRRPRTRVLTKQVYYEDDGSDVSKSTLNVLRKALELDEEHGVDSASFYGDAGRSVDDFIVV